MGILDWARGVIERNMQSAAERDAWWVSYVRGVDTARRDMCVVVAVREGGGREQRRATRHPNLAPSPLSPAPPSLSFSPLILSPPATHTSKEQWAVPTKGAGSWTSETATARYEARQDAALKALRRPRIDE